MFPIPVRVIVVAALMQGLAACDGPVSKPLSQVKTLQHAVTGDRSESFSVNVSYEIRSREVGLDNVESWMDNLSIYIVDNSMKHQGRPGATVPFEQKIPGSWHSMDGLALWQGQRRRHDMALPSGRILLLDATGEVLFIYFDGDVMHLYALNRLSNSFLPVDPAPYAKALNDFYKQAYDPDDVHWSYGLVRCADFFGVFPALDLTPTEDLQLDRIYSMWYARKDLSFHQ